MAKDLIHLRLPPKRPWLRTSGRFTFGGFEFSAGRQDVADDPEETTPSESFYTPNLHGARICECYRKHRIWIPQGRIVFLGFLLSEDQGVFYVQTLIISVFLRYCFTYAK